MMGRNLGCALGVGTLTSRLFFHNCTPPVLVSADVTMHQ
jgi:hypothetical protein